MRTFISALYLLSFLLTGCSASVKEPNVAGAFYPADGKELAGMVDGFLKGVDGNKVDGRLIALIAPHAGYQFSGQVAAFSYGRLKGRDIDTVIIIGSSHYASYTGASVYTTGGMMTPLGTVKINEKVARGLLSEKDQVTFFPAAFDKEHSIEVQLPFLQRVLKNFSVVPILIGAPSRESFNHLSKKLAEVMKASDRVLLVVSTDLSHYHDYQTAAAMDRKVTDAVQRMSSGDLEQKLMSGEAEACGGYALLYAMAAARDLGATDGRLFKYANSGDVTGDVKRVVGYAAMGLYKSALDMEERAELLSLAIKSISEYVKTGKAPSHETSNPRLLANGATFVTIKRKGMLRGCIGNISPVMPLFKSVIANSVSASSFDPRFPKMAPEELTDMEVEVTVLSPLEPLRDRKDIKIGTHGLFIVKDNKSGLLLPQVAEEFGWDVDTFLREVSLKAGLPEAAWKDSQLFSFTADIIR